MALGIVAFQRNLDYRDNFSIWQDTAAKAPGNERPHQPRPGVVRVLKRPDDAIAEYEAALKANPDYAEARGDLAVALAESGRVDEAIVQFRKVIEIEPRYAEAYHNLGRVLADSGKMAEAIPLYERR